jgi:hypothetical protein
MRSTWPASSTTWALTIVIQDFPSINHFRVLVIIPLDLGTNSDVAGFSNSITPVIVGS